MLECIAVVADMAVRVVVVNQKIRIVGEDVARREVARRKLHVFGLEHFVDVAGVVGQVAARFVAQVGRSLAVAGHLHRIVHADGAVVGGDDHRVSPFREEFEDGVEVRMFEP